LKRSRWNRPAPRRHQRSRRAHPRRSSPARVFPKAARLPEAHALPKLHAPRPRAHQGGSRSVPAPCRAAIGAVPALPALPAGQATYRGQHRPWRIGTSCRGGEPPIKRDDQLLTCAGRSAGLNLLRRVAIGPSTANSASVCFHHLATTPVPPMGSPEAARATH
jgi:hypothetical protein